MREFRQKAECPDFRSVDGLYNQKYDYPPEGTTPVTHFSFTKQASSSAFTVTKCSASDKKPNKAHYKLAELRQAAGKLSAVVTQNIDGLHQAAGSKRVYESARKCSSQLLHKVRQGLSCRVYQELCRYSQMHSGGGIIKPDVVLYEEGLDDSTVTGAVNAISKADTLIIAGTSLTVYPAAGFIRYFGGDNLVLINRDPTPMDKNANLVFRERVGELLDKITVNI